MIELNKNSWHFRMAKRASSGRYHHYTSNATLCTYAKDVFVGSAASLFAAFCIALGVVGTIMQIVFSVQHGVFLHTPLEGSGFIGLLLGIGFFVCLVSMLVGALFSMLFVIGKFLEVAAITIDSVKAPSVVVEAYKGFKGKYCPTVTFTER